MYSARDENDEEWGWGDDDDDNANIEMTPSFANIDTLLNRRQSSGDVPHANGSPRATPKYPKASLSLSSNPSIAPVSGLSLGIHGGTGPVVPPPAPMSGSSSLSSGGAANTASGQAPVPLPSTAGGMPTRITSLGKKKPTASQPTPKKKAVIGGDDDDIFASMGLSSQPKFTHAPAPATAPPLSAPRTTSSSGGSRWAQTTTVPGSANTITTAAAGSSLGKSVAPTTTNTSTMLHSDLTASSGGDDADWDDDADLDDLLG